MARLEGLPPEIRLCIYRFIFRDIEVCPSPILYARHPDCDKYEKAIFEDMQAAELRRIGIFATSRFFQQDQLIYQAFYSSATFGFSSTWHWPAFKYFLGQRHPHVDYPAQLINRVQDATRPFGYTELNLDPITPKLLPNLKHIHLTLFRQSEAHKCSYIHGVYDHGDFDKVNCAKCELPWSRSRPYHPEVSMCNQHGPVDPSTFFSPTASTRYARVFTDTESGFSAFDYDSPSRYVITNFFNDFRPAWKPGGRGLSKYSFQCRQGRELKERILDGDLTLHLSWQILFDHCTNILGEHWDDEQMPDPRNSLDCDRSNNANFSSADWTLRCHWQGKDYKLLQNKPSHYDEEAEKFILSFGRAESDISDD